MRRLQATWRVPARGMHVFAHEPREVCRFRLTKLILKNIKLYTAPVYCRTVCKSVEIPKSVPMIMATKGEFLGQLQRIAECRLRKVGSNMVSQLNH